MTKICEVRLLQVRREFDRGYSYLVPDSLDVCRGNVCAVPFGKSNRPNFGIITKIYDSNETTEGLKGLFYVLESPYKLSEEIVDLCIYFSEQLLCTIGELARCALPSGLTLHINESIELREDAPTDPSFQTQGQADLYLLLKEGRVKVTDRIRQNADFLIKHRIAKKVYSPETSANRKLIRIVRLNCDPELIPEGAFERIPLAKREHYLKMLRYLKNLPVDSIDEKELCERFSVTKPTLVNLEKRGLLQIALREVYRAPYESDQTASPLDPLNDEQISVFKGLARFLHRKHAFAALLHGITGSGKTRVMLHLIQKALQHDKGVIFLVPEIGLTSRTAQALLKHFPNDVTILHSALSEGERHDAWVSLKNGNKKIVLGTRSAIFAPIQNLGLILVDEEQDQSYHAENSPRYHARDIARFRAATEKATLVLASATPDIESFHKAKKGKYSLYTLGNRATGAKLPSVEIVDVKEDIKQNPDFLIGEALFTAMKETLDKGEQCMLFMNRRGYQYAPFCPSCGHVITCPHCSVALTLHSQFYKIARCHYCGYSTFAPEKCPTCGAEHLFFKGYGTQRLEEEVKARFENAKVLRMDADTVSQKLAHDDIIQSFLSHKADILLGTQMIAKGHDFPEVTLVGVVMADTSLYLGDYRATEDTFALLTQVIGRAGRGNRPGRAIVQTLNPDHEVFSLAAAQNYNTFYEGEIALRKAVLYPPFCCLSTFTLASGNEQALLEGAEAFNEQIATELEENEHIKVIVYGPLEPSVAKVNNLYRRKFVVKHQNDRATREMYARLVTWFNETQGATISLSFDLTPSQI